MRGYKVLTHDLRPPVQGGEPLWNGDTLPLVLPKRKLDTGSAECAAGWNYCKDLDTAFQIAGLWPFGRPSRAFLVEPTGKYVERGDKCRAEALGILRPASQREVNAAIRKLSEPFGDHAERMARSQIAWRRALARPKQDEAKVEAGLRRALRARGLDWPLRRYGVAWAARDAWAAGDAWAARDALVVEYAALRGWTKDKPDLLTTGIRSAYEHGLELAIPTGPSELGWAITQEEERK